MGLVAAVVVPNLQRLFPAYEQRSFIARLSALVQFGWQQALATQKVHRIFFDIDKRLIRLEQEAEKKTHLEQPEFKLVTMPYTQTEIIWPEALELKQFYINTVEYIARPGIKTETTWFFIVPDGLCQSVIINFQVRDTDAQEAQKISLVLNPFTARFKQYDTFQKP